jgi:hypothetical protein
MTATTGLKIATVIGEVTSLHPHKDTLPYLEEKNYKSPKQNQWEETINVRDKNIRD